MAKTRKKFFRGRPFFAHHFHDQKRLSEENKWLSLNCLGCDTARKATADHHYHAGSHSDADTPDRLEVQAVVLTLEAGELPAVRGGLVGQQRGGALLAHRVTWPPPCGGSGRRQMCATISLQNTSSTIITYRRMLVCVQMQRDVGVGAVCVLCVVCVCVSVVGVGVIQVYGCAGGWVGGGRGCGLVWV